MRVYLYFIYLKVSHPTRKFGGILIYKQMNVKIKNIIKNICKKNFITDNELLSKKRNANLVIARVELVEILRNKLKLSFPMIGEILGKRDHTTIIHLYKKIREELFFYKRKCLNCNKVFKSKIITKKFCNSRCYYEFSQSRRITYKQNCLTCGKEFKTTNSLKKYCSDACKSRKRNFICKPIIREYFLEKANFKCEKCGNTGILECHHKKFLCKGGSDLKENIIVLCPKCHWEEHQDKSINMFIKTRIDE